MPARKLQNGVNQRILKKHRAPCTKDWAAAQPTTNQQERRKEIQQLSFDV